MLGVWFLVHRTQFYIHLHHTSLILVSRHCTMLRVYVAAAAPHQGFGLGSGCYSAAGPERRTIEASHGVREIERAAHFPARDQPVDERAVEDVARARGIDGFDDEPWGINVPPLPQDESAVPAQ